MRPAELQLPLIEEPAARPLTGSLVDELPPLDSTKYDTMSLTEGTSPFVLSMGDPRKAVVSARATVLGRSSLEVTTLADCPREPIRKLSVSLKGSRRLLTVPYRQNLS